MRANQSRKLKKRSLKGRFGAYHSRAIQQIKITGWQMILY
jgi:hypothetical protein